MSSARLQKVLSSLVLAMGRRKADLRKKVRRSRPKDVCAVSRSLEAHPPCRPRATCCTLWMNREERSTRTQCRTHIMHCLRRRLGSDPEPISQKRFLSFLTCACLGAQGCCAQHFCSMAGAAPALTPRSRRPHHCAKAGGAFRVVALLEKMPWHVWGVWRRLGP